MKKQAALASAKWFIQDRYFESIVNICCLNPDKNDWHIWHDGESNFLRLTTNRKMRVFRSNQFPVISDIYRYAKPAIIADHSYWIMIMFNKQNVCGIWLLGYDERLRFIQFSDGNYYNKPPLLSAKYFGIKAIKLVAELIGTSKIIEKNEMFVAATLWPPDLPIHNKIDNVIKGLQS